MRAVACTIILGLAACNDGFASRDAATEAPDAIDRRADAAVESGAQRQDGSSLDASKPSSDLRGADANKLDGKKLDAAPPQDTLRQPDAKPDAAKPDVINKIDAAKPDAPNTTGLTVPCQHGPGYTLFRFHYGGSSTSPSLDVWDATCSYSYAPNSACNVYAVYPGFGSVSTTSQGYPILTTSEYLRVRFSVAGLSFSKAAVYIQARSYATSASTYYQVWSPIYGGLVAGPVDNDWVYDWYGLDWTGYLDPSDAPALTAIQIYAGQGSGSLAVEAVELCVQ